MFFFQIITKIVDYNASLYKIALDILAYRVKSHKETFDKQPLNNFDICGMYFQ